MIKFYALSAVVLSSLFGITSCDSQSDPDPYWQIDEDFHFQSNIDRGDFFSLSGFDFGWLILEPMSLYVGTEEDEIQRTRTLSYGQKALYFWWYLDGQVSNGGFGQFYDNGYGKYVPTIIRGLEYIGDEKMAALILEADRAYNKEQRNYAKLKRIIRALKVEASDNDKLDALTEEYFSLKDLTMSKIEAYIRTNVNEFALDEQGNEINPVVSGFQQTYHDNSKLKSEFHLEEGKILGFFNSYFDNGNKKELIEFEQGNPTGIKTEYLESGHKKIEVTKGSQSGLRVFTSFHENGKPKKQQSRQNESNALFGEYKEWYENGQLMVAGAYDSLARRSGEWIEFYSDGQKRTEAEVIDKKYLVKNHWDPSGKQLMKNGDGIVVKEHMRWDSIVERLEIEYKNFKKHGAQREFLDGVLVKYQEYDDGKLHGYWRSFYRNGNIKSEVLYQLGVQISNKGFAKFKNPKVQTRIKSELCKGCYERWSDYVLPDNSPSALNFIELEKRFKADPSVIKAYDDEYVMSASYYVFINPEGQVEDIQFSVGSNAWLDEEIRASISELRFEPALSDGAPVSHIQYVRYEFQLIEL